MLHMSSRTVTSKLTPTMFEFMSHVSRAGTATETSLSDSFRARLRVRPMLRKLIAKGMLESVDPASYRMTPNGSEVFRAYEKLYASHPERMLSRNKDE